MRRPLRVVPGSPRALADLALPPLSATRWVPHQVGSTFRLRSVVDLALTSPRLVSFLQWLLANSKQRLRNFLVAGSDLAPFLSQLSKDAAEEPGAEDGGSVAKLLELNAATELDPAAAQALPVGTAIFTASGPPAADPIADTRIPTCARPLPLLSVRSSTLTSSPASL